MTIAHGDYRIDNLFFGPASSSRPLVAIDWQIAMRSRGAVDVAYFLGGSLQIDDRRRHERALIEEYHNVLTALGVRDYSLEDCWTEYRWSMMYATVYPVDAGSFDLPTDNAVTMVRHWVTRFFGAVTDLNCVELLDR
jgi:thiamine kinase-like enzyme